MNPNCYFWSENITSGSRAPRFEIRKPQKAFYPFFVFVFFRSASKAGLPDCLFLNKKYHFGLILEGLAIEDIGALYGHFGLFYRHLAYIFGGFHGLKYIFYRFGMLHQEKSGNPVRKSIKKLRFVTSSGKKYKRKNRLRVHRKRSISEKGGTFLSSSYFFVPREVL
jgi:hypothetical protein